MAIIPTNKSAKMAPNFELMSERIELIMNGDFLNVRHKVGLASRFRRQDVGNQGIDLPYAWKAWNSDTRNREKVQ
jgi:hypothetical protein